MRGKARFCLSCVGLTAGPRAWYCAECRERAEAERRLTRNGRHAGTAKERGYGEEHRRLRRQWAPLVEAGRVVCWRCKRPILPGEEWDLGHDDFDRGVWRGPEHRAENRSTSTRAAERRGRAEG